MIDKANITIFSILGLDRSSMSLDSGFSIADMETCSIGKLKSPGAVDLYPLL